MDIAADTAETVVAAVLFMLVILVLFVATWLDELLNWVCFIGQQTEQSGRLHCFQWAIIWRDDAQWATAIIASIAVG